ncbi:MAG: lysylphosphatidylglycerol synthase transmembrane domain-containing protein, partial [Maribacter sp.]
MDYQIKKTLKTILPITLGVFLVWYWFDSTAEDDREQIIRYIKEADLFWVGSSILLGVLSHISRAIRWNYLIEPLGYRPKLRNNILIILMSYFANLGIPRMGEILRPTALATYEGVPFEKGLGTIVTERVIDVLMLFSIIAITLFLQTEVILGFIEESGISPNGIIILAAMGLIGLFFFFIFIKQSNHKIALKIKHIVYGLMDGLLSIFKMKNKWAFVFHTFFIWTCYIGMFWVVKFTVLETEGLSLTQLMVAFVAGSIAMMVTNGGVGLYPIMVSKALAVFGISSVSGDAFGWIMWI